MTLHAGVKEPQEHICKIRLLRDDDFLDVVFHKSSDGDWLLDYVCKHLNIVEKYYFGLRYNHHSGQRRWLQLSKPIQKQLKDLVREPLCFRVRYYPARPVSVHEEITRYHVFMQLRRDLYHGRLVPRPADLPQFCALILQSDLGDFEDNEFDDGFTNDIEMFPKLATSLEDKITQAYQKLSGISKAEAEEKFLGLGQQLDTYGVDPIQVMDKNNDEAVYLGANHQGIGVFQSSRRIKLHQWSTVKKVSYERKIIQLIVQHPALERNAKKQLKFKCKDEPTAKSLWLSIQDQQAFFTLGNHEEAKLVKSGSLFRRNSFRFSGRCLNEVVAESSSIVRMPPEFIRSSSTSLNRSSSIRLSRNRQRESNSIVQHSQSMPIGISDAVNGELDCSLDAAETFIEEEVEGNDNQKSLDSTRRCQETFESIVEERVALESEVNTRHALEQNENIKDKDFNIIGVEGLSIKVTVTEFEDSDHQSVQELDFPPDSAVLKEAKSKSQNGWYEGLLKRAGEESYATSLSAAICQENSEPGLIAHQKLDSVNHLAHAQKYEQSADQDTGSANVTRSFFSSSAIYIIFFFITCTLSLFFLYILFNGDIPFLAIDGLNNLDVFRKFENTYFRPIRHKMIDYFQKLIS